MALVGRLAISLVPAMFLAIGVAMVYKTHAGRSSAATVAGAEPAAVEELRPGDGYRQVQGTARALGDDTLPAAMLDASGVAVLTSVEERSARQVGEKAGTDWDVVYGDFDVVPFAVDDGTGSVEVAFPDGGEGVKIDRELFESEPGERPPESVRRWLAETDAVDAAPDEHRAYRQGVIEVGERVTAMGTPVKTENGVALGPGDEGEFVVADASPEEIAESESYGVAGYVVGAVLALVGLVPLAYLWVA
ncbi:GIDE domain-containing protein [Halostella litorea]|uniref:GIDE domain-containing protein n=1 Tax=Halostella litorea TaxID=2528831 RepID=UPI001092EA27|nr:GIDE domain-containing protein [Halostella litorea]